MNFLTFINSVTLNLTMVTEKLCVRFLFLEVSPGFISVIIRVFSFLSSTHNTSFLEICYASFVEFLMGLFLC